MPAGDVYHLTGYSNDQTFRNFVKQLLLIMLTAEIRETARRAIHSAEHLEKSLELPPGFPSTKKPDFDPVMDAIINLLLQVLYSAPVRSLFASVLQWLHAFLSVVSSLLSFQHISFAFDGCVTMIKA
jgi:hypothetical protein